MNLKGKKIAFFVALPHHSRFLFPVADLAKERGAELLFFTTLVDYPYEIDFIKRKYRYKFLIEYADKETKDKIQNKFNTLLEEWTEVSFSWQGFRQWSLFNQDRALRRNIEDFICLEELIKKEKPDMFVVLHEMNPWGKQIGYFCSKYAIPYVSLQEGDYHTGVINFSVGTEYSTASLVWGSAATEMLRGHKCSINKTVIIGNTHIDEAVKQYSSRTAKRRLKHDYSIPQGKKVVTFMFNVYWGTVTEKSIWQSLLKDLKRKDILCIFKWHPQVAFATYEEIKKIIKNILPDALVFFSEDPYRLIAVSDYCIVMGKTTLGVEALAFDKPLFCLYNIIDGEEYYKDIGVAQSVSPAGNWNVLFKTMQNGIPEQIRINVSEHLKKIFYRLDGKSTDRALDVLDFIFRTKADLINQKGKTENHRFDKESVPGKVSFILPSGDNIPTLMATLTSLSNHVHYKDWELIIIATDEETKPLLSGLSGDVKIIEAKGDKLSKIYNEGAEVSSGEYLIFMLPGIIWFKSDGFLEAIKGGMAGMPLRNSDLSPFCLGIGFDFNFTPYVIINEDKKPETLGTALIGIDREVFKSLNGFDEEIAYLIDICLSAKEMGYHVKYLDDCLALVYRRGTMKQINAGLHDNHYHNMQWKSNIGFFVKWHGKLNRDDDYLAYAKEMIK